MLRNRRLSGIYLLFFFSGAAGLVYEVVWSRLLQDVFGVTAHAVAVVLATYLGGLALGSWVLGPVADRRADPLRFYGLLEIGIGATALAGSMVIRSFDPIHIWAASRSAPDSGALVCVRLLLSSLVTLPPTFLMGGTLPAMTKVFVGRIGRLGRELSFLYALNTSGAVAGSLAAGFVLIRALGIHPTLWLAIAINVAVGAFSLLLAARSGNAADSGGPSSTAKAPQAEAAEVPAGDRSWLLLAIGLSGVASLALEVIWTRTLILIVGTSTYAFVMMLSAFLVGIALGSFGVRLFVDRIANPRRAFGWVQAGIAASTVATIPLMGALVASAQRWLGEMELHWLALAVGRFGISFLIMIVPTTLIGMTFPLAGKIRVRGMPTLGGELGQVYAVNTLGNILGAVVGGFLLLPTVGMQRGIALLATLNLAGAAWGLLASAMDRPRPRFLLRASLVLGVFFMCVGLLAFWRPGPFTTIEEGESDPVRYYREGLVSTVKVIQRADDARQLVMFVDATRIGQSSSGIDNKQQVLAHFPFLLKSDRPLAKVLSVGLGTGILIGEVARHPGVESIECVEISPSVIEAARFFGEYNGNVLENPTARIILDDGVNFLKRTPTRYDAIISDGKSRLGHVGNALFYSEDYYRSAREHLGKGGLMIQWMPLEEVPEDMRTIVRTFMGVFPHAYLWIAQNSSFLVGTDQPLVLDLAHIQRVLDAPETADLRRYGWRSATEVASLLVADNASAKAWLSQESTINSLETPVLEFYSPRALATPAAARVADNIAALAATRQAALQHVGLVGASAPSLDASSRSLSHLMDALSLIGRGDPGRSKATIQLLEDALAEVTDDGVIRRWVADILLNLGIDRGLRANGDEDIGLYRMALTAWPDSVLAHLNLGSALAAEGGTLEAVEHFHRALQLNPDSGAAHRLLAEVLHSAGNPEGAIEHFREALRRAPDMADVHNHLGQSLALMGRADEAMPEFREAMRLKPRWPAPMAGAALLLATHPNPAARQAGEAIRLARRASELTGFRDSGMLSILAISYAGAGRFDEAVASQHKVLDLVSASADPNLIAEANAALDLYRRGIPRR